ncbi:hypothetical protein HF521_017427 [Silurus meridionalis]|uniref:ribonuclease H n=1 Tax=Silurus meridionalis TaxID=175797 RepID=A0A8T0BSS9_SILME|nr:hypothetical protein HF521_017427 [Silurus meridionalis]
MEAPPRSGPQVDLFATKYTLCCPLWFFLTHPVPLGLNTMSLPGWIQSPPGIPILARQSHGLDLLSQAGGALIHPRPELWRRVWSLGRGCKDNSPIQRSLHKEVVCYKVARGIAAPPRCGGAGLGEIRKSPGGSVHVSRYVALSPLVLSYTMAQTWLRLCLAYAPQVVCEMEEKETFWSEIDEEVEGVLMNERLLIGADLNGHVGEGNRGDKDVMGRYGFKERNVEGQMRVDFAKRMEMAVVNTNFKKEDHRVSYKSEARCTQVDYVLCRRCNLKEIGDCKVLAGDSVARQHQVVVCRMVLEVKKKRRRVRTERRIRWWKLKGEDFGVRFREEVRQGLGGGEEVLDDWATTAEVIRGTTRKDMYEDSVTAVKCAVGTKDLFKVEVGLHQGSALSPFLFAVVKDSLTDEVRQESPWTMMVADDIVICGESREQVEKSLEGWKFTLERRGMKVSRRKTEFMCVKRGRAVEWCSCREKRWRRWRSPG